jgi:polysaccharide pyruvyl transferase WcaK-like protein
VSARYLVLGDYNGGNLGHNAYLLALVHVLSRHGTVRVRVPSLRPNHLNSFLDEVDGAGAFSIAPWRLSLRFLGLPLVRELRRADYLVLSDNLLYDRHLWNPLRNGLAVLPAVCSLARARGTEVVYFAGGIGPLHTRIGCALARRVLDRADSVSLRDALASDALILAPGTEARVGVDVMFGFDWTRLGSAAGSPVRERRSVVGVNVSEAGVDRVLRAGSDGRRALLDKVSSALVGLRAGGDREIVFVVTHARDKELALDLARRTGETAESVIELTTELESLADLAQRIECFISDRYHELSLLASGGVPVVAWAADEKIEALLDTLGGGDCLSIERSGQADLGQVLKDHVERATDLRSTLVNRVAELRAELHALADLTFRRLAVEPLGEQGGEGTVG